jgi:uncharacterized protein YjbI with pentapeptide repeats
MSCPVCFNASTADETVRASLNLGIVVLMGVTAVVLAGFLRFVISIARLSRADLSRADLFQADLKVRLYDDNDGAQSAVVKAGLQARLPV